MISRPDISWILHASFPEQLAEFYSSAMGADALPGLSPNHWFVVCPNGIKIQIYRPSTRNLFPIKGRAMAPCLQAQPSVCPLKVIEEWSCQLIANGAKVIEKAKIETFGAETWMSDPEGNAFLLLVPNL